jgi:hypothetical protein
MQEAPNPVDVAEREFWALAAAGAVSVMGVNLAGRRTARPRPPARAN